jgi:hypothetical protein
MADPDENLGVGGGTPPMSPLGGPSLEAEEKAMRKGKGRMLAAMIVAVVAALALFFFYLTSGGENEAYRNLGQRVNGLKQEHFDQFWGCALRGVNLGTITDNASLTGQLDRRMMQGGPRYAVQVRDECMDKLAPLRQELDSLIPPEDMQADVNAMAEAASQQRSAWANLIAYLESDEGYDPDTAGEPITQVARAWYDFKRAHSAINAKIREKIGE